MNRRLALALLVGCGEKPAPPAPAPEVVASSDLPAELARWMPVDPVAVWQGAHVTRLALRDPARLEAVVLDIQGEAAKGFDGETEHPLGFAILAPCLAGFEQARMAGPLAGTTLTHTRPFLIERGTLSSAPGMLGMRRGKAAIACSDGPDPVVTLDDHGACKAWRRVPAWNARSVTCAWSRSEDGRDLLTIGAVTLIADGDRLTCAPLRGAARSGTAGACDRVERGWHTRHPSYDAAKQALLATP